MRTSDGTLTARHWHRARHVTALVDGDTTPRNHHYMTTRHDPGPADADADAAGIGSAEKPARDATPTANANTSPTATANPTPTATPNPTPTATADADADAAAERGAGAAAKVRAWLTDRIPAGWFEAPPDIQVDREEITIMGTLPDPAAGDSDAERAAAAGDSGAERAAAAQDRIRRFREETRGRRIEIAREAEHRFRRKVSWGVVCGPVTEMFTTLSVPVMTRLRQSERRVLDTLVDAGVARSRSDALAWCVRLTGENADEWLSRLRAALRHVEEVRDQGP